MFIYTCNLIVDSVYILFLNINSFLFSFLYFLKVLDVILITLFLLTLWSFFINTSFKTKIIFFLFFIITVAIWGTWASLDIFMLFLLLAEFFILFLFLIVSWNVNFFSDNIRISKKTFALLTIGAFLIYFSSISFNSSLYLQQKLFIYNYVWEIITNDLFIYFYFFFVDYPLLIIYLTLILTLFSLLFIWFYFILRRIQLKAPEKNPVVEILREQKTAFQFKLKPKARLFQK